MCELQLTVGIMSCTALLTTLCVKGGTHPFLSKSRRMGGGHQEAFSTPGAEEGNIFLVQLTFCPAPGLSRSDHRRDRPDRRPVGTYHWVYGLQLRVFVPGKQTPSQPVEKRAFGPTSMMRGGVQMEKLVRCLLLIGAGFLFMAGTSWSQASESEMRAFPMPPVEGVRAQKTFAFTGDYGYYTFPRQSESSTGIGPEDYVYVRYTGISGKKVYLYGAWGTTPIPPPGRNSRGEITDACGHAHNSYGVWAKYDLDFGFFHFKGWRFLGGGGRSGTRDASGRCVFSTNKPLKSIDARFGWGQEFLSFDFTGGTIFTELVVGVLSNTHGWGSCGAFACQEPSYIIQYLRQTGDEVGPRHSIPP